MKINSKVTPINKQIPDETNSFSVYFKEFYRKSTFLGLVFIFREKHKFFRLLWLFVISILCGICVYQLIRLTFNFFSFDYSTSIKSITEMPALFPAITLCQRLRSKCFNFSVLGLTFNRKEYESFEKRNSFISQYKDSTYGNCYRFLENKSLAISTQSGIKYGLEVSLFIHNQIDIGRFAISIYNHSEKSTIFNKDYFISTGSYNYFSILRIFEEQLPQPYNNCYKDLSLFPLNQTIIDIITKKRNTSYTQRNCVGLCKSLKLIEESKCKCSDSIQKDLNVECRNDACKEEFVNEFYSNDPYKKCSNYCPLECDYSKLETLLNSESLPSCGNITNGFIYPEFKDYTNVSRSFLHFNIYYEDVKYILIKQIPKMESFDFFSNVGGLFGLFLGMSLLSFFDIIDFFFKIFLNCILKIFKKIKL